MCYLIATCVQVSKHVQGYESIHIDLLDTYNHMNPHFIKAINLQDFRSTNEST